MSGIDDWLFEVEFTPLDEVAVCEFGGGGRCTADALWLGHARPVVPPMANVTTTFKVCDRHRRPPSAG